MFYFWQIIAVTLSFVLGFVLRGYFRIELRNRKKEKKLWFPDALATSL